MSYTGLENLNLGGTDPLNMNLSDLNDLDFTLRSELSTAWIYGVNSTGNWVDGRTFVYEFFNYTLTFRYAQDAATLFSYSEQEAFDLFGGPGVYDGILVDLGGQRVLTVDATNSGLTVASGSQRIHFDFDWSTYLSSGLDYDIPAWAFGAGRNGIATLIQQSDVPQMTIFDEGAVAFQFTITPNLVTVKANGETLGVTGEFDTARGNLGEITSLIAGLEDPRLFSRLENSGIEQVTRSNAQGEVIAQITADGSDLVSGTTGDDTYTFQDLGVNFDHTTLQLRNGDDSFEISDLDLTSIEALAGSKTIEGGGGQDTLRIADARDGRVSVNLAAGSLSVLPEGNAPSLIAELKSFEHVEAVLSGADSITVTGSYLANTIDMSGSRSVDIRGRAGDDLLTGARGDDTLRGGTGDDTLDGGVGADYLDGGDGLDEIRAGSGADTIASSDGADDIDGGGGIDLLTFSTAAAGVTLSLRDGSGTANRAEGQMYRGIENVFGSAFGDQITGDRGANGLSGDLGDDLLVGLAGDDDLNGGSGDDTLIGGSGDDVSFGYAGDDLFIAGLGMDRYFGGSGIDTLTYQRSKEGVDINTIPGTAAETDTFDSIEIIIGSRFDDRFVGGSDGNDFFGGAGDDIFLSGAGNDSLVGGNGDDTFIGDQGRDTLEGGGGKDIADYSASFDAIRVNLAFNQGKGGDAQGDKLRSIEDVIGSEYGDVLLGNYKANLLEGGSGDDVLSGGVGNDVLSGGVGRDILTGGSGRDNFVFVTDGGNDLVRDFQNTIDTLDFTEIGLANLQALLATGSQSGDDVVFDLDAFGLSVTVRDTNLAQLENDLLV